VTSVLDLLINEVANVLGITPEEVKTRFTQSELTALLNNSLCEPTPDIGIPITGLDAPCDDLAIPNLLPPVSLADLTNIGKSAESNAKKNNVQKCVEKVDEANAIIEKQIDSYNQHRLLLDKLLEYRDNYSPVFYYFDERSKEAARMLNTFGPILTELRRLEALSNTLNVELTTAQSNLSAATLALSQDSSEFNTNRVNAIVSQISQVNSKINSTQSKISNQNFLLKVNRASFSIFSNQQFKDISSYLTGSNLSSSELSDKLVSLFTSYITQDDLDKVNSQFKDYAEGLTVNTVSAPKSIKQAVEQSYFSFKLKFPQLDLVPLEKEKANKETGDSYRETATVLIKNSPLLEKRAFFDNTLYFTLTDFILGDNTLPNGKIYEKYYNLFKDPINNFFSLEERGLTTTQSLVDPSLKGTDSEIKKEGDKEYYIQNLKTLQNFYENFDTIFTNKKSEKRSQAIEPLQEEIRLNMQAIARKEVQLLLALSRANKYLPTEDGALNSVTKTFTEQNNRMLQGLLDLDAEIARIKAKVKELKPTPQKIKALLKEKSPECFEKIDQDIQDDPTLDCSGAKSSLGTDPFFVNSINGCDPTLPNQNQICYWVEFAKVANMLGLLPIPNIPNVTQLRYWPVGLTIPYPGGLIKIPLPIIWIPLVALSTPLGNIVIFLTVNGVFISPVVFFVSSNGFKQHTITVKGPSKKFGYSAEDSVIKPGVNLPASLLSVKAKADRLSKEATLGKNYNLTDEQKIQLQRQKNILGAAETAANQNNNDIRKAKVKREKSNFEKATENLTDAEQLARTVDKVDSIKDIIDDAKHAILNRIDELGKPPLSASNRLKDKISKRNTILLSKLQDALASGDDQQSANIRSQMTTDGVSLNDKISAIKDDLISYFDRIKFPKIVIPKDATTIDPKLNAILEFLDHISEFSNVYQTQFFSKDDSKVQRILTIQLAKSKEDIKAAIREVTSSDGTINVDKDTEKVKTALKKSNKILIDEISGTNSKGDASAKKAEADALREKSKTETDPIKKKKLQLKYEKAYTSFSQSFDRDRVKLALALTPEVIASLNKVSVDFNPFAPCCKKKSFELALGLSPAIPIFISAKALLDGYIDRLTPQDLKALFGGKTDITANDISSVFIGIIKNSVPADLSIPLPDLSLLSFAKSFSGVFSSLFEIKAPNLAAQPALPLSIKVDLNLLKKPLAALLITYLENSLPDPSIPPNQVQQSQSPAVTSRKNTEIRAGNTSLLPTKTKLDDNIQIVNCDPATTQRSVLSDGKTQSTAVSTSSNFSSGNVIVNSKKDVLPNFQTLSSDFLSINPGDLLAILKNFIDLKFETVEDLLTPFYKVLSTVKGLKGLNLNILEAAQYKLPPYGPADEAKFIILTGLKKQIPKSAGLKIIDLEAVIAGSKLLEKALGPIANSPLPAIIIAGAGAVDSVLPSAKIPTIDTTTGAISTKDIRAASFALRSLHPILNQDDLPPWERLTVKNILFLLFLDEFVSNAADKLGFFRSFI